MSPLDPVVLDALNRQITHERQNAALYSALANRFDALSLTGLAKFTRLQAAEEESHADFLTDYIIDRYGFPLVAPLEGVTPPDCTMLNAARVCFSAALAREQITTEQIKVLYDLADEAGDPQTCQFLMWFLKEQTQSEREFAELVARATLAEGCAAAVLALDEKLGGD